jgi:glycerol-3-phosphate O-acyltransferase/dihydroxyacetone phosphate acyltransferase
MFFRRIDVLNKSVMPSSGPVILVGNHANQFIDGMNLVASNERAISFMIAKKSYDRPYIGDVAKALCAVPVQRPQDIAVKGQGKIVRIVVDEEKGTAVAHGEGTQFTKGVGGEQFVKGCKLLGKWEGDLMITGPPLSDTELPLKKPLQELNYDFSTSGGCDWKLLPKIDQSVVFDQVYDVLGKNGVIGIFPEGGSHDQGHLIPLKAGVTIMALGAAAQGTPVRIVPVGLTYFHAHRFRSVAVTQFGAPFQCPPHLVEQYKTDSRGACSELLEIITDNLKKVTVNTPDYQTNKQVQTVRRLFVPDNVKQLSGRQYMAYNRSFINGFEAIQEAPQTKELLEEVDEYMEELVQVKWLDKELRLIQRVELRWGALTFGYILTHLLITLIAGPLCVPGLLLMLPVIQLSTNKAVKEQAKALAGSKVKVGAYDVVASEMVKWAMTYAPLFWIVYTAVGAIIAGILITESHSAEKQMFEWITPVAVFFLMPGFCYYSVRLSDTVFFSYKKFTIVSRKYGKIGKRLIVRRQEMQRKVREFVASQQNQEP